MEKERNKRKAENASGGSKNLPSETNPRNALKPVPKISKISTLENAPTKALLGVPEAVEISKDQNFGKQPKEQSSERKQNNENQPKENNNASDNNEKQLGQQDKEQDARKSNSQTNLLKNEEIGGVIFMCNTKTKSDCYRYMVMGFPDNRIDLVLSIKPDIKLFLYDYHLKVLHGIYKAASPGGLRLEPAAFNGSFPAQVRFKVDKECAPLPFRALRAFPENYDSQTNMVKCELSVKQVEKLTSMFLLNAMDPRALALNLNTQTATNPIGPPRPIAPDQSFLHQYLGALSNSHQIVQAGSQLAIDAARRYYATPIHPEKVPVLPVVPFQNPLALSATNHQASRLDSHQSTLANSQLSIDEVRRYHATPIFREMVPTPREVPPIASSQMGHQAHGLRPQFPAPAAARLPVGELGSQQSAQADSLLASKEGRRYSLTQVSEEMVPRQTEVSSSYLLKLNETNYQARGLQHQFPSTVPALLPVSHTPAPASNSHHGRFSPYPHLPHGFTIADPHAADRADFQPSHGYKREVERGGQIVDRPGIDSSNSMLSVHATHAANALSDYNRRQHQSGSNLNIDSMLVSSRYSFDGPSAKYR